MNWLETLTKKANFTRRIAEQTERALDHRNLPSEQSDRLYKLVLKGGWEFDQFVEELNSADLEDDFHAALIEAAVEIEKIWSALNIKVIDRLRKRNLNFDSSYHPGDERQDLRHAQIRAIAEKNGWNLIASDVLVVRTN